MEGENEELDPDEPVDGVEDVVDPAVEASDESLIEQVVNELNGGEVGDECDVGELRELTPEEISLGQFTLEKVSHLLRRSPTLSIALQLTNLGKRVFNSSTLREDLKTLCEQSKIKPRLMIRAWQHDGTPWPN
jgi:hypothetical protein